MTAIRRFALLTWGLVAAGSLIPGTAVGQSPARAYGFPGSSLESLLAYARDNNPEFAAMRADLDAAQARVGAAGALPDPVLRVESRDVTNEASGGSFNLLPARVGSTKYTISQSLPFWGKRDLKHDVAVADADQARGRTDAAWRDLATRLKVAYAQYFLAAHSEQLAREVLVLLAQVENLTQNRYANGLIPQQDVIRAQVERSGTMSELVMLETERHHLRARLNALLNRPPHAPLATPTRLRPLPTPAAFGARLLEERLQARSPQLQINTAQLAAAERSRELVLRNRYPDFTLGVSPIQQGKRIGEWELMVEMNIPLQQDARRAQEREAEAMLTATRARRDATAAQLSSELAEALIALDAARRLEDINSARLLPQADLAYRAALAGYENGKVDFATLLDAQRQIRKAQLDILKAQVDQQIRLAEIEKLIGEDL